MAVPAAPGPPVYRPRHPERTSLYQLIDRHFEAYRRAHPDRFEPTSGPLRPEIESAVHAYLDCGRLHGGFARIRCLACGGEHLLAFSCRTRNLCPSCQAKRSTVFAAWVATDVLLDVAHRHVVFTIPKALRGLIARERRLHGLMARTAWAVLRRLLAEAACEPDGVAGAVLSLQTFGAFGANFHPHLHAIVTEGVFTEDGRFHPVIWPEASVLAEAFRQAFLEALEKAGRLRPATHARLLAWRHSGFSVSATQRVPAGHTSQAERLARYATRVVVASSKVHAVGEGRVRIDTPPDPRTGRMAVELDVLEAVHATCQHVPPRRMHLVRYYGSYANRRRRSVREARARLAGDVPPRAVNAAEGEADAETRGAVPSVVGAASSLPASPAPPGSAEARRRQAWAQLLRKVFEVEPLVCPRCGQEMKIVARIADHAVVDLILRHRQRKGMISVFEENARAPPAA